jgi:hypothetical protein
MFLVEFQAGLESQLGGGWRTTTTAAFAACPLTDAVLSANCLETIALLVNNCTDLIPAVSEILGLNIYIYSILNTTN